MQISNLKALMIDMISGDTKTPKPEEIVGSAQMFSDDRWQRAAMPCKFVMWKAVPRDVPCRNVVAAHVETAASVEICLVWESCKSKAGNFGNSSSSLKSL